MGTSMEAFWVEYPGLPQRLNQLGAIVDRMAAESLKKYGRRLDLAVLPEVAVNGEAGEDAFGHAFPLEGAVKESFSRKAREHQCYIVVPMYLLEERPQKQVSNVGVLFDRKGEVAGIYRKLHPAVSDTTGSMEGGITPGKEAPVFECDFGKLGMQICFDIYFDYGWRELAAQGRRPRGLAEPDAANGAASVQGFAAPVLHRLQHLAQQRIDFRAYGQDRFAAEASGTDPCPGTGPQLRHPAVEFEAPEGRSSQEAIRRQGWLPLLRG